MYPNQLLVFVTSLILLTLTTAIPVLPTPPTNLTGAKIGPFLNNITLSSSNSSSLIHRDYDDGPMKGLCKPNPASIVCSIATHITLGSSGGDWETLGISVFRNDCTEIFHAEGIYLEGPDAWDHNQWGHFHAQLIGINPYRSDILELEMVRSGGRGGGVWVRYQDMDYSQTECPTYMVNTPSSGIGCSVGFWCVNYY